MTARFDSPQAIVTGGGCRAQAAELLSALAAHRTLMVVDFYFVVAEFVAQIQSSLGKKGITAGLFTDFQPDPTDQNVLAGRDRFRAAGADCIVAIGESSALDVAKMIGATAANTKPLNQFQEYHRI